jgi:1-acyl-sn-glycerol-3-phosphate acyltransferase
VNALRGIALFLLQCVATPLFATLMVLGIPLGGARVYALAKAWCGLNVQAARWLGLNYRLEYEAPRPVGPAVVLSKHSSAWETFFIVHHFPRLVPVIKRELLWLPFFGWGLALCRPIAIDRSLRREARAQLQDQGVERLRSGLWVMIFPEGTRIPAGKRGRYATGGASLAISAGVPVLAMAHDAGFFWRKSLLEKRGGTIRVRISAPMYAAPGETATELTARAEAWIEDCIVEFGHPPAVPTSRVRTSAQSSDAGAASSAKAEGAEPPVVAPRDAG